MKFRLLLCAAGALVVFSGCFSKNENTPVASVTPMEAYGALKNGFAVLVDVREKDEIAQGMAAPARWIATSEIDARGPAWNDFVKSLPKDKQIVFYCRSGNRSGRAASALSAQGFRTANMGGFAGWSAAGLPTKKP